MATTAHSLSVHTNSCYKPPVDVQKDMAASAVDQRRPFQTHFKPENREEYESDQENQPHEANISQPGNVNFDTALTLTDTLQQGMSELSDDQFYEKLMQLKNEHKKTGGL